MQLHLSVHRKSKFAVKYFVAAGLLFITFFNLACSKPCNLTPENAPELRGFRLGMTLDEIKRKFPNLPSITSDENGLSKIYFDRTSKPEQSYREFNFVDANFMEAFKGTRRVYLELTDNKVAVIKVVYTDEIPWKSEEEFIKRTAESLNIPGTWTMSDGYNTLQCQNSLMFQAGISRDLSHIKTAPSEKLPYIQISNIWAQIQPDLKKMDKEKNANAQREAQKNTFTP